MSRTKHFNLLTRCENRSTQVLAVVNEISGLEHEVLASHSTDPALHSQLLSNRETLTVQRLTEKLTARVNCYIDKPFSFRAFRVRVTALLSQWGQHANNSRLVEEEGVVRTTAKMHRVMEERIERERFCREMNRREKEIREQRVRERMEREERGMVLASGWPEQQEAISGLGEKITRNIICGKCGRQEFVSRSSLTNTDFSNELSTPALEQCVLEACPLVEAGNLREREEREQFESKIERKEREIREQRARKRREREARELEEASRRPQQQEAVNVPWCACHHEGEETAQGSEQGVETLPEPQQET